MLSQNYPSTSQNLSASGGPTSPPIPFFPIIEGQASLVPYLPLMPFWLLWSIFLISSGSAPNLVPKGQGEGLFLMLKVRASPCSQGRLSGSNCPQVTRSGTYPYDINATFQKLHLQIEPHWILEEYKLHAMIGTILFVIERGRQLYMMAFITLPPLKM